MPRNNNDFLTSGQMARELGVHKNTVKRAAVKGIVKSSQTLGGHRRYSRDELERIKSILNEKA